MGQPRKLVKANSYPSHRDAHQQCHDPLSWAVLPLGCGQRGGRYVLLEPARTEERKMACLTSSADDSGAVRDSIFSRTFGTDFLAISFRAARAADPSAKL